MLRPIFGHTLDYDRQVVGRNDSHTGGKTNSFTPGYIPNMAPHLWSWDYSMAPTGGRRRVRTRDGACLAVGPR